jgi:O-antigen/teichoic acid export membrane protein
VTYAAEALMAARAALTPVATALHAQEEHDRQQRLFVVGGRYCLTLSLLILSALILLGRPLIACWIGPAYASAALLLMILAVGEVVPLSQAITSGMILGMARHKVLGYLINFEQVIAIAVGIVTIRAYGLVGLCIILAVSKTLMRGFVLLAYGCRLTGVTLREYAVRAVLPPLAIAAPPAAVLGALIAWKTPENWPQLIAYAAVYGLCCGAVCIPIFGAELQVVRLRGWAATPWWRRLIGLFSRA